MTRRPVFATAIAVMFMLYFSGNALAIYSWVDENGQTHISDFPKPENVDEDASADADKGKDSSAPVLSDRALKAEQAQPAAENARKPLVVNAPVPVPPKNEQPIAPSSPKQQPILNSVPSSTVRPPALPVRSVAGASTIAPREIPPDTSAHGAAMQNGGVAQMIKTFVRMFFFFLILAYLYFSLCLRLIARKLNVTNAWLAWVPLIQIVTLLESASKPLWWALLLFVPLVNIIVHIYLWMCISENLGKEKWLGLLMLVPVANLIFPGMLAFSKQDSGGVNVALS